MGSGLAACSSGGGGSDSSGSSSNFTSCTPIAQSNANLATLEERVNDYMTLLPDVSNLYYTDKATEIASGKELLLALHGGPTPFLDTDNFAEFEKDEHGLNVAYVYQAQQLEPACVNLEEISRVAKSDGGGNDYFRLHQGYGRYK